MSRVTVLLTLTWMLFVAPAADAQDPPPRIGVFVIDLHASVPRFPSDATLADSRDMRLAELPGRGLGLQFGATVYPFRWRAVTFGIGGELTTSRARQDAVPAVGQTAALRRSEEKFSSLSPQLSFNFGTGHGWSYISGGIARSTWSLVPDGRAPFPSDAEKLKTINYGGGARWFIKPHLAFSFDVRLYAINPGAPYRTFPGSPRTTLMVIAAGISVK